MTRVKDSTVFRFEQILLLLTYAGVIESCERCCRRQGTNSLFASHMLILCCFSSRSTDQWTSFPTDWHLECRCHNIYPSVWSVTFPREWQWRNAPKCDICALQVWISVQRTDAGSHTIPYISVQESTKVCSSLHFGSCSMKLCEN